jgi:hypothetical protein
MSTTSRTSEPGLPRPSAVTLGRSLAAGIAGLIVWEVFARLIAPLWIGSALDPTGLVEAAFGISGTPALMIHLLTGLLAFPIGYVFLVQPLAVALAPGLPWPVLGLAYGVALWVFAMYGMASLLGGMPPFLDFAPIAWASLVGHLGLGLGIAGTVATLDRAAR